MACIGHITQIIISETNDHKFSKQKNYIDNQKVQTFTKLHHFDGLVQDCSNSIANALELLQSCAKPSILYLSHISHIKYSYLYFKETMIKACHLVSAN